MRRWFAEAGRRLADVRRSDDGDVPGWVMVTLMSALLVAAIFALAQTQLTAILTEALETVLP
jgi:hypothetical protein